MLQFKSIRLIQPHNHTRQWWIAFGWWSLMMILQKCNFWRLKLRIHVMRDGVTCPKFATKPCLIDIFSNLRCLWVVFTWAFFLSLLLWELVHFKIKICILKPRLVGDLASLMLSRIRAICGTMEMLAGCHGTFMNYLGIWRRFRSTFYIDGCLLTVKFYARFRLTVKF